MVTYFSVVLLKKKNVIKYCFHLCFLAKPEIILQPSTVTVCIGGIAYFQVKARGNGPLHYTWYHDGKVIEGECSYSPLLFPEGPGDVCRKTDQLIALLSFSTICDFGLFLLCTVYHFIITNVRPWNLSWPWHCRKVTLVTR